MGEELRLFSIPLPRGQLVACWVDLVCAVFSCAQATTWLPMLGILNMCTDVTAN